MGTSLKEQLEKAGFKKTERQTPKRRPTSKPKHIDGVCNECQRRIKAGVSKAGMMLPHPAVGVYGNMNTWETWFNEFNHNVCKGSGTLPAFTEEK